ncbi:hypothetical protein [Cellulomonas soli]
MMRLSDVVRRYLEDLEASPATRRQRRWALEDLATFAAEHLDGPDPSAADVLREEVLEAWLVRPGRVVARLRWRPRAPVPAPRGH